MLNYFINIPTEYFIYFLYGSAFLFLSFAIFVKDMKGSDLKLADSLWLLGMFGLTHGLHELLALYPLIEGAHLSMEELLNAKLVSLVVLVLSFLFLLQFGLALTLSTRNKRSLWSNFIPAVLVLAWVAFITSRDSTMTMRFLGQTEKSARLIFCLTGASLTAYGLMAYSHEIKVLSRSVSRHLWYAGVAFIFYGVFAGVFVTRFSIIPLPFPIELLRGLTAIVITYFIIKALNVFNIEMRKRIEQQTRHLVQTEKLTSLGQLAAGIAHEINNPLTNASLGIQTLKLKFAAVTSGGEIVEKLDAVERNIDKASMIARELLQFSRQRESEFSPVNMNSIIRGAMTLLQYKLRNILIRQDLAAVPEVLGDAGQAGAGHYQHPVQCGGSNAQRGDDLHRDLALKGGCSRPHRGHGAGNPGRKSHPGLRSLFYHKGTRIGNGARPLHLLRHHKRSPRNDRCLQHEGQGNYSYDHDPGEEIRNNYEAYSGR